MGIKKIAILTSGGDAPGMNSAIKAIVDKALDVGLEPYLVYEGYKGLVAGNFKKATKQEVKFFNNLSGTAIYSARLPEFAKKEVRQLAVDKLNKEGIDALIVIGGDGSYMGAAKLDEMGIKTIGLPGTIDNDIAATDYTIGFSSALNYIIKAIEAARSTSESHMRCNIIETMGRDKGDLALYAAIATGAEVLSIPERILSVDEIAMQIKEVRALGNRSIIVVITENHFGDVHQLAKKLQQKTGVEIKATQLGHPQRGGPVTAEDRLLASAMGVFAVNKLLEGETGVAVNLVNNKLSTKDILEVVKMKNAPVDELLEIYDAIK